MSYRRSLIDHKLQQYKPAIYAKRCLYLLLGIALSSFLIANERPLYCQFQDKTYFPAFRQYAVELGFLAWNAPFQSQTWQDYTYQKVIFPPIPYSPDTQDKQNTGYKSPFAVQNIPSLQFRHWLGTDKLGRDVASGVIHGTRMALWIGLMSMSIATFIGVLLGALAGYFGDNGLKISRIQIILNILILPLAYFWAFVSRRFLLNNFTQWAISILIFLSILFFLNLLLRKNAILPSKQVKIPLDVLIMRMVEIFNAIPKLLLLLALIAVVEKPSTTYIIIIIGLLSWTSITKFVRAELLRIRALPYIEAARAIGMSEWRIIFAHALPNALPPVLITISFGIASAILAESSLSFLGLGLPIDTVTWGSMLEKAREYYPAWWLAFFPGLMLAIVITTFNLIGEGLSRND